MNHGLGSGNPGEGRHGEDASGGTGTPPEGVPHARPHSASDGTPPPPPSDGPADSPSSAEPPAPAAPLASAEPAEPAEPTEPSASEEDAVRRLLQDTVRDLEPSEGSLDHLHRAVPARRTRRRQALAGAVAAALVAVVGVPTLLYGGVVPGIGDDKHPLTASSSQGHTRGTEGGDGAHDGEGGDKSGKDGKGEGKDKDGEGKGTAEPSPSGGPGNDSDGPGETLPANAPTCGRDQLGQGSAQAGAPDGEGKVYGSFRVTNTSGDACTVEGEGMVGANVQGGSARSRVAIMDHTPGDPAPGLGDPATASDELVLRPGASYLVKFAWVPGGGSGCSGESPPPNSGQTHNDAANPSTGGDTGGDGDGADSGGGSGGGTTPGDGGGSGDPGHDGGDTSVVVSHTPEVGSPPVAGTTLDGACGGTVYRTGVLPAS